MNEKAWLRKVLDDAKAAQSNKPESIHTKTNLNYYQLQGIKGISCIFAVDTEKRRGYYLQNKNYKWKSVPYIMVLSLWVNRFVDRITDRKLIEQLPPIKL